MVKSFRRVGILSRDENAAERRGHARRQPPCKAIQNRKIHVPVEDAMLQGKARKEPVQVKLDAINPDLTGLLAICP